MFTMRPQRRLIMPRATSFVSRNGPFRFASSTASQSSSPMRNSRLSRFSPALFTSRSTGPTSASTRWASASICAAPAMSQAYPFAPPPNAAAAPSAFAPSRPQMATFAPLPASPSAIERPMPREPPVTRATLPDRSMFMPHPGRRGGGPDGRIEDGRIEDASADAPIRQSALSLSLHTLRHLVGSSQRDDARPRDDSPQHSRQHLPRADLDEARAFPGE